MRVDPSKVRTRTLSIVEVAMHVFAETASPTGEGRAAGSTFDSGATSQQAASLTCDRLCRPWPPLASGDGRAHRRLQARAMGLPLVKRSAQIEKIPPYDLSKPMTAFCGIISASADVTYPSDVWLQPVSLVTSTIRGVRRLPGQVWRAISLEPREPGRGTGSEGGAGGLFCWVEVGPRSPGVRLGRMCRE